MLIIAESSYFARECRARRGGEPRDVQRAGRARKIAIGFSYSLADDIEALRDLGMAHAGWKLARKAAREAKLARIGHCRAEGLDLSLVHTLPLACEGPIDPEEETHV